MRSMLNVGCLAVFLAAGCAARPVDWDLMGREAIYDRPLEEVWPSVRQYFVDAKLSFREAPDSPVLQTEWKEEFGGSKISGYWHRYLVLGKRETPTKSKLWIIRVTRSANKTLSAPGKELEWGASRNMGMDRRRMDDISQGLVPAPGAPETLEGGLGLSMEDDEDRFAMPRGENAIVAESAHGTRDLTMEWRVFNAIAPGLEAKDGSPPRTSMQPVAKAPEAESAPAFTECGAPILGLKAQAKAGGVMLLGELHGTQEVPRFIAQSACQLTGVGTPVSVGLELPVENQARITTFLQSQGREEDWLKLMEAPFWRSPYPDGRGSEAVANMLEQLRQLRARGLDVAVFVYDHPKLTGQQREQALAATVLKEVESGPARFHLVVSGNIHPRTAKGLPWDKQYQPMGRLLAARLKHVVALDVAYDSGSAWICAPDERSRKLDCGVKETKGKDNGDRFFVHVWDSPNKDGYHGVFYVGRVTASAPAISKGLGRPGADDNSVFPSATDADAVASARR
ncbi:hypothetical protein D7Y11_10180 [Corallococcus sp. AB018]|uniref:hypothetical protein n=1 Tax=Corallococcus sp. AB018 TaxID=2316715 RepID=UPI000F877EA3|nr:hypothetical protein [Corallococcus sp. AB018]RUO93309.1 hypothetical protein D7Y11_10180 [Corallococcus sp. AB018]